MSWTWGHNIISQDMRSCTRLWPWAMERCSTRWDLRKKVRRSVCALEAADTQVRIWPQGNLWEHWQQDRLQVLHAKLCCRQRHTSRTSSRRTLWPRLCVFFFFFLPVHKLKIELTLLKAKGTASSCPTEQRRPRHIYYLPSARLSSTTTVASGPSILQLHSLSPILYTVATARFFSAIFTKFPLPQLIHYIHRYCKHQ